MMVRALESECGDVFVSIPYFHEHLNVTRALRIQSNSHDMSGSDLVQSLEQSQVVFQGRRLCFQEDKSNWWLQSDEISPR